MSNHAEGGSQLRPHGVALRCIHRSRCMHPAVGLGCERCIKISGVSGVTGPVDRRFRRTYLNKDQSLSRDQRVSTPGAYGGI